MKIHIEEVDIPKRTVRRMVSWICKGLGVRVGFVNSVTWNDSLPSPTFIYSVNNNGNLELFISGRQPGTNIQREFIVRLVAEKIASYSKETKRSPIEVARRFRDNHAKLWSEWNEEDWRELSRKEIQVGEIISPGRLLKTFKQKEFKQAKSQQEINAERAAKNLANWKKKFDAAEVKMKEYAKKVKYYQDKGVLDENNQLIR